MFKILIIQSLYNLSDDAVEFQILDRLSFMRFLKLGLGDRVPDSKTIWFFREYSIDEKAMENCRQILNEVCTCGCQGTGKFREVESKRADLESLKRYEEELHKELN